MLEAPPDARLRLIEELARRAEKLQVQSPDFYALEIHGPAATDPELVRWVLEAFAPVLINSATPGCVKCYFGGDAEAGADELDKLAPDVLAMVAASLDEDVFTPLVESGADPAELLISWLWHFGNKTRGTELHAPWGIGDVFGGVPVIEKSQRQTWLTLPFGMQRRLMRRDASIRARLERAIQAESLVLCGSHVPVFRSIAWWLREIANAEEREATGDVRNAREGGQYVFQKSGHYWTIVFDGSSAIIKDSVGLQYIARLLVKPLRSYAATELLALRVGLPEEIFKGDHDGTLDPEALESIRGKVQELEEEHDAAKQNHDLAELARTERDIELLRNELKRVTGLGGRIRIRSNENRIRTSTTMAVRRAIQQLTHALPSLGRHLGISVQTGTFLRYAPDRTIPWDL
ncbi:MAG: hypothetical protein ACR2NO_08840 [Chloroflexota bacterium]